MGDRTTPDPPAADLLRQAMTLHGRGELAQAEAGYRRVLAAAPGSFDALHMLGVVLHQTDRSTEAIETLRAALRVREDAAAQSNLGIALRRLGRLDEALAAFDRAVALQPGFVPAHNNRGNTLRDLRRNEEALASYDRALALKPDHTSALRNRADALRSLGRHDEALADLARALAIDPRDAEAWLARANTLVETGRPDDALASYESALRLRPAHASALSNVAGVLLSLARPAEALAFADRALAIDAAHVGALVNRAGALGDVGRHDEAIAALRRALALAPDDRDVRFNLGSALLDARRSEEAIPVLDALVAAAPGHPLAAGQLLHARMLCCDWAGFDRLRQQVVEGVRAGGLATEPFGFQAVAEDPALLRTCAVTFAARRYPEPVATAWRGERYGHRRLRIGYVSGEFREQATSILMAEVFERHDRERFEVVAFDNGTDDGSALRRRLLASFDAHVDIAALGDERAAEAIRAREIDVLVNLNGYFGAHRLGVFARRPAPVQVNYLGFPGTIGHGCLDYVIADATVIPPGEERHYVERVVRLPGCYQANDSQRRIAEPAATRRDAGLPDDAFVFCCFNNPYKILPAMFAAWMRVLAAVPGSLLWLFADNAAAVRNLRREAAGCGVDASRIVFASRLPPAEHLARHALADLFVDTVPYNAHTTASDALWAGLPLLTCEGATFPGRVAASLLRALGLPELVSPSLAAYEATAIGLARDRARLASLRRTLAQRRATAPLFDGSACCRHLETAYETMASRVERGEPPAAFDVGGG